VSFTFLQEQGEESSAASFSDIPAYVLSRLNLTAATCYSNDHAESDTRGQESESGNGSRAVNAADIGVQRVQRKLVKKVFRFTPFPWGEDVRGIEDLLKRSDIPEPLIRRIGDDVARGVDRLKSIGSGQVPRVVAVAWKTLA